jgi:hypothetical protein
MSRDGDQPNGDPDDDRSPEPEGTLRPLSATVVAAWAAIGVLLGVVWKPLAEKLNDTAPVVSWAQPAALWLIAVVMAITWWQTHRVVQVRRARLEPHRAVNRLVLARAGALVGALVAGAYAGYAISWIGDPAELAGQRIVRSLVSVAAGVVIVVAALLLERACRVRKPK